MTTDVLFDWVNWEVLHEEYVVHQTIWNVTVDT
jgi:hypothetical protein